MTRLIGSHGRYVLSPLQDAPLGVLGLDSMEAMQLMALLEDRFSVRVWSLGVWCVTLPLDAKAVVLHSNVAPIQHSRMK